MTASPGDDLLHTIEAVHAAALNAALWPRALGAVARTVGGGAASLEVLDGHSLRHRDMHSYGMPGAEDIAFAADFPDLNIRMPFVVRGQLGELSWDYKFLDESVMRRASFYTEVLPRFDLRYFVAGVMLKTAGEVGWVAVHLSPRTGHVQQEGIATMAAVLPHVRQAFDVSRRLRSAELACRELEHALDALCDGVALLKADGTIAYANSALAMIARQADGITIHKNTIAVADTAARARYAEAMAAVLRLRHGDPRPSSSPDVLVPRRHGAPAYVISVRPLLERAREGPQEAVALVFIHDPLRSQAVPADTLRQSFSLTPAEAGLAQALQRGLTPVDHARAHGLTLNTVYTHLRRLREKTGCTRMPELIRKLNDATAPLRSN